MGTKCGAFEQREYRKEAKRRGIILPKTGKAGHTLPKNAYFK